MFNPAREYWEGDNTDVDGMLGGIPSMVSFSHVSKLGIGKKNGWRTVASALEGRGGGGGGAIDFVTDGQQNAAAPVAKFVAPLEEVTGERSVFNVGLEDWLPSEGTVYDLIWLQWCVGYLADEQLVAFRKRCEEALNVDGGVMVVKENFSTSGADALDEVDWVVTRVDSTFLRLFDEAGWRVIRTETQKGFSYAFKPRDAPGAGPL
ncbi:alpha-N-methyltransferase NTM1 [Immersiella caudata]|uniref:Alpha N-terminal protein methyltransferase 1 n=1 Tax=Immersiella caudata TaxID=314043 RepID=A0AA40BZV0_9PEZI|nr:alpha-N-methyltransferase NTM1 [Immersiella caudata]